MSMMNWMSNRIFQMVHRHHLVYNTCWEDPRLDRTAMGITAEDVVLVITSAGCNALDYLLDDPKQVIAVDMNPRQNALLELKLAGIRNLRYEDFFAMFGRGRLDRAGKIYGEKLRPSLSSWAQGYWDRWIEFFEPGNLRPFYFRGTSGTFAKLFNFYIDHVVHLRASINDLLNASSIEEQRAIYDNDLHDRFWSKAVRFTLNRDAALSLVGVPRAQRQQIDQQYRGGIAQFVHDCMESVFAQLPINDNYFWRVYITGQYSRECCPEYLKPDNFKRLKGGLIDRLSVHTDSIQGYLEKNDTVVSRFVLLDHMDWLSGDLFPLLEQEWQWIIRRTVPHARLLWRSGGLRTDFVDRVSVQHDGSPRKLGELLIYDRLLAEQLHRQCRVHTYGSFYIADLAV